MKTNSVAIMGRKGAGSAFMVERISVCTRSKASSASACTRPGVRTDRRLRSQAAPRTSASITPQVVTTGAVMASGPRCSRTSCLNGLLVMGVAGGFW